MSSQYVLKIEPEQAKEMPMVDLAFAVLKAANTPFYYRDLMQEIARIKGMSDEEVMQVIAQLYTEINIDGRFACVGNNLWGLKRWYPVEKTDDAMGNAQYPRIINDDDDDLDEEDFFAEEEDDSFAADDEDYDAYDDDQDEFYADEDEVDAPDIVDDDVIDEEAEELEDAFEETDEEEPEDDDFVEEADDEDK